MDEQLQLSSLAGLQNMAACGITVRHSLTVSLLALLLTLPCPVWSGQKQNFMTGKVDFCSTIEEEDASPSMAACQTLKIPSGTFTDNGDGTFSFAPAGTGDITSVGDVASGLAFDGTQGTLLTFNDADGDQTLGYDATNNDFEFSDDLDLNEATPHLKWVDTTASEDDYEAYADLNSFTLSNVTDGIVLLQFDSAYAAYLPNLPSCNTVDTNAQGKLICGTDSGGGGNSFETIAVPAGASVVADSSTDTLTLTETSFLTLTGTAATDTIDITQVTTDLGTDGLIAANAVYSP